MMRACGSARRNVKRDKNSRSSQEKKMMNYIYNMWNEAEDISLTTSKDMLSSVPKCHDLNTKNHRKPKGRIK